VPALPVSAATGLAPRLAWLLRWPLPALLSWAGCWAVYLLLRPWQATLAMVGAVLLGLALALPHGPRWRRLMVAGGFPLSLLLGSPGLSLPGWGWLAALALLVLAYPRHAWQDAPLFPTPHAALQDLPARIALRPDALVLDAGCGVGDGLRALRRAYPAARIHGVEWSRPWAWVAALRCPWAAVRRGDMWAEDWSGFALVYLFQRPESMPRAWAKACQEMHAGSILVSLDFAIPGVAPYAQLQAGSARRLWVYQLPARP